MSRRWIYCFQPRFAELVASGAKRQTIRGERKDGLSPAPGDVLSLRAWVGRPRASKQRLLRPECPCIGVSPIRIDAEENFWLEKLDITITWQQCESIARDDGFTDWPEMLSWFRETHGLPFRGVLIRW